MLEADLTAFLAAKLNPAAAAPAPATGGSAATTGAAGSPLGAHHHRQDARSDAVQRRTLARDVTISWSGVTRNVVNFTTPSWEVADAYKDIAAASLSMVVTQ